jgi:hypothetical protein
VRGIGRLIAMCNAMSDRVLPVLVLPSLIADRDVKFAMAYRDVKFAMAYHNV